MHMPNISTYLQIALSHGFNLMNAKLSICSSVNWALVVIESRQTQSIVSAFIIIVGLNCWALSAILRGPAALLCYLIKLRFNASSNDYACVGKRAYCVYTITHTYYYSVLPNKRTGLNHRILRKNLDQGSMMIFDQ